MPTRWPDPPKRADQQRKLFLSPPGKAARLPPSPEAADDLARFLAKKWEIASNSKDRERVVKNIASLRNLQKRLYVTAAVTFTLAQKSYPMAKSFVIELFPEQKTGNRGRKKTCKSIQSIL